jgi:hypothetical protein
LISEERLSATGLPEKALATYRLAGCFDLPLAQRKKLAKKLKVAESTVKRHLSQVRSRLGKPRYESPTGTRNGGVIPLEVTDPEKHAKAVSLLSAPLQSIAEVAREVGMSPSAARKIAKDLDGEMLPLKRAIEEVRVEDLTKRFGTLTRDAIDAITPEKLMASNAQQLAVISGIAAEKWQLMRGQPTSRTEIGDRRQMNELLGIIAKEAKRRGIEIDVTPEGGVTAKKSPYRSARDQRLQKEITSGDPAETLSPA